MQSTSLRVKVKHRNDKSMKYVVTAINRLTGEREAISRPHEKFRAETMKRRYIQRCVDVHDRPYTRLKVEPAVSEGALWPETDTASLL